MTLRASLRFGVAIWLALTLGACGDDSAPPARTIPAETRPGPALTERAQRDSARVAVLIVAYFDALAREKPAEARSLFFPESLRVATPSGGVDLEGRSSEADAQLLADAGLPRVRRIVLLRRATTELLDNNYREIWHLRWVPDREDSTEMERRIHVLQQLGDDARWLGRMAVSP